MLRQVAIGVLLGLTPAAASPAQVAEPDGYRTDEYRAPVPASLAGATVIDTETAEALWEAGEAAFIDVMPRPPKPANLPEGTVWRDQPRDSIPGALWLPNVGYGDLAEVMADYFRSGLEMATGGDADKPLVFFCLAECWMSWNAARRALEYGHSAVFWYPEGTDGWGAALLPLERVEAVPGDL
jgi:PQQ-dependent catabolism-associated CXXCW motif protein